MDKAHLADAEVQALGDKKVAEDYFRAWAFRKCPAAEHMNVGSGIQVRQLTLRGRAQQAPGQTWRGEGTRVCDGVQEWTEWDESGREGKAPKKAAKFTLHGITKRNLQPPVYTTTGLPAVSGAVLRALAGKPGAARALVDGWNDLSDADKKDEALAKKCGSAFLAFGGGFDGVEACAAVDALNDVAAIDTLLSNFIIPSAVR